VIPPDANAAFAAAMEDVLETYQKPRDPDRPLVCLDETSKQLVVETRKPIPAKPGQPVRYDYEYERNGVANIFMTFAPLEGWRKVKSLPPRRRGSPTITPPSITPKCSRNCRTRIFPTPNKLYWFKTT
jgi:hypothetical protein